MNAITNTLSDINLSLSKLRGQGHDGASTVKGQVYKSKFGIYKLKKALYTHCAGHSLNLAIVNSCSITPIQNCISQIKGITMWFKSSPKWEELLKAVYHKGIQEGITYVITFSITECLYYTLGREY